MLAPRSAKALHEKVLLKLHGIRKLPGSLCLGGTLFCMLWVTVFLWLVSEVELVRSRNLRTSDVNNGNHMPHLRYLRWLIGYGLFPRGSMSIARKITQKSTRLLVSESVELSFKESERQHGQQPTWVHRPLDRNFEEYQESDGSIDVKNWRIQMCESDSDSKPLNKQTTPTSKLLIKWKDLSFGYHMKRIGIEIYSFNLIYTIDGKSQRLE
ncbi:hypothetical protein Tco_0803267 [Tanacetum coccineum]|uniref:Uncharacterized protein n=1 Tax=Tanacetum coccineum TaxID=301880 RepID=A0ABQ5A164_9ASTR